MNGRTSFLLHLDSLDVLNDLTDSECGQLLKAMVAWQKGDEIELDKVIKVSFSPFKNQFIRDNLKYEKTVKARQGAGSKGGKAKADNIKQELANASKSKQELANLAVSVSDSDSVSDSVSDNVSDSNKTLIPIRGKSPDWMDEYKTAFWSAYLKKVDKTKTMTLLTKMIKKKPDVEHWQMVLNHIQQKAIVTEKQYWPAPTRFLRDELWQDELPVTAVGSAGIGFLEKHTNNDWAQDL